MPLPLMIPLLIGAVVVTVAAVFWEDICNWYIDHAAPWLAERVPSLAPYVGKAFAFVDKHVIGPARALIRKAWLAVRPHLLGATVSFHRFAGTWMRRIDTYVRAKLVPQEPVVHRRDEQEVSYDDLPAAVREAALTRDKQAPIDFIANQDSALLSPELS